VLLLACAACERQWSPPPCPDPSQILHEAEADVAAHHNARALAKHLWFYRNALGYEPGLYGVRLSYALNSWHKLASVYPPAMTALVAARDEALITFERSAGARARFHEFVAINAVLGQGSRTREAFIALGERDPARATSVFDLALPDLIRGKDYALCIKYFQPSGALASAIELFRKDQRDVHGGKWRAEYADFTKATFTNRAATLVALLVVSGRLTEADDIARRAKASWDDPTFHAAVDRGLQGVVPDPYP
jgi:hypothetical protein